MKAVSVRIAGLLWVLMFAYPTSGFSSPEDCAAILTSMTNAQRMYEARGSERNKLFVEEPHFIRIREGMPSTLRIVSPQGKVYRHYTSEAGLKKILASKKLQAGQTPFYYSGYIVDYNVDLTGIFITSPTVKASSVGVRPEYAAHVDFKLNEGTGMLFLRDDILLIPGTARAEHWKVDLYKSDNRKMYQEYAEEFARWDREGIPQPLEIPIEIIGHSK